MEIQKAERPVPLNEPNVEVRVLTDETWKKGDLMVGMTWQGWITFAQYLEEVNSKIKEFSQLIDHYESMVDKQIAGTKKGP